MSPREQIASVARAILDGSVEPQAGCRRICFLQHDLPNPDQEDKDLSFIVGVDSELDECPVGAARQYWEAAALAAADLKRDEYLDRINDHLVRACRVLAQWQ